MHSTQPLIRSRSVSRHTVLQSGKIPSIPTAMREIRRRENTDGEFTTIDTPQAAQAKTLFKVYASPRRVMLAVCLLDGPAKTSGDAESLEIFFDPRRDGIGYLQYVFTPCAPDAWTTRHHLPYPEFRSTAYSIPEPLRAQWFLPGPARPDSTGRHPVPERWLFVFFDRASLFREADPVGFNIGRIDDRGEVSSWNHSSGHGLQSPSSFGKLFSAPPESEMFLENVERREMDVIARGWIEGGERRPALRWLDPLARERRITLRWSGKNWTARIRDAVDTPGRHRLVVSARDDSRIEPETIPVDLADSSRENLAKSVAVTYDFNVNVRRTPAYTPEALDAEMRLYAEHGVGRLYWIDFNFFPLYQKIPPLVRQGEARCGPFLPLAAKLAKQRGMDFYGIFKPFDLLWNPKGPGPAALPLEARPRRNGSRSSTPESRAYDLACRSELTMQRREELPRPPSGPVRRIEFFSQTRLTPINREAIRIWISDDNISYRPYRGALTVRQGTLRRPHLVWTAAGNRKAAGAALYGCLILDDLTIEAPYVAVTFTGDAPRIQHRAHAIATAYDDRGEITVIPANGGNRDAGFNFWTDWPSWANRSQRMLETLQWDASCEPALTFRVPNTLPSWIEPACDAARDLWMFAVDRLCATEADGLSLRTLCHHKPAFDLLMYAYGPDVRRRFQQQYGREPEYDAADAERIRCIRGDAYSEFVAAASRRVRDAGKRFSMHFEAGIEVPPSMDQRMQMDLQWERWIQEGWLDEIVLKWWFAQNPFVHEKILPAARRAGIKVWLTGRNSSLRRTPRRVEHAAGIASEARAAGFDGFSFYEAADWMERNAENIPVLHNQIGAAFDAAAGRTHMGTWI